MLIIEKNFGSLSNTKSKERGKNGDVLAEKKVILSWLMNSNTVKPEKFYHLYLVYHFTVPIRYLLQCYVLETSQELLGSLTINTPKYVLILLNV